MTFAPRLLAPVAAPPPPKPPQLNIVASSLMPDVATDTFGPGEAPLLASGAFDSVVNPDTRSREWTRLPGDERVRDFIERRNALVAAVEVMSDVEMKQAELDAGVTVESLPSSIFAATADSRWTGGFAYAPENQYRGLLNDWAGQTSDLPYMRGNGEAAPTAATATPSNSGGSLTNAHGAYSYLLAGIMADGSITLPTAALTATVASGSLGSVALAWTDPTSTMFNVVGVAIFGRDATNYKLLGTVATGVQAFTDTGALAPSLASTLPPLGNLPNVGFVPYLIQVQDQASAFGWEARDYVGRALRLLDFATPAAIERELWSGAFAQAAFGGAVYQGGSTTNDEGQTNTDFPQGLNAFFTQSGTPSSGGTTLKAVDLSPGTPPSVARGTQILEDYLANSGSGGQGMIHVAPETSPNLLGARRVGSLLLSVMDNIIVPGSGYPTKGAQGPIGNSNVNASTTTAWMFATDLISVRLDAPMIFPSTFAEALDRQLGGEPNLIRFRAQRFAAATWDGARLAACRVTLAT